MSRFLIPSFQIDLVGLPPAILTSEPGSFARYTLKERVPGIVQETVALNTFPDDIREAMDALYAELTGGVIHELREDAPDRAFWNMVSAPYIGRTWLDVPWYWAEAYFYRRLLQGTRYFQPGPWQGVDPFGSKKATELVPEAAPDAAKALLRRLPDDPAARFEMLLHASLWGNRMDLSYEAASRLGRPTGAGDERSNLKPQPFFVSDAMPQDVTAGLDALEREGDVAASLAGRLRTHIANGRLHFFTHWHYATSLFFFQLPEDLHSTLAGVDLVLVKGDANYRRLLGDAHWPPTTAFASATSYFPAPIAALRTPKAEIIVGLRPGEAERLQAEDPAWLVNGQRGIVQARV